MIFSIIYCVILNILNRAQIHKSLIYHFDYCNLMKICFVMPPMASGYWKKLGKKVGPQSEPLSLCYIASYLNSKGYKADIIDCIAEDLTEEEIEQRLREGKYDIVGVTMLTLMYTQALNVCKIVKKINPKTYVVIGGPHPTIAASATLQNEKDIDFAVIGEAEITFYELLKALDGEIKLSAVDGLAYKTNDGKVMLNNQRKLIDDLDILPMPDRSLLKMELYRPSVSYYKRLPAYIILTTRGCPYRCTFCSKVFDKKYRQNSVEYTIKEMKYLMEEFGAKEIVFRDDTFTMKFPWVTEFCNKLIEEGLNKKIRWSCMTRVNLVNLEMLKLMKKAGCWGIHFGVESGNQRLLNLIKKDVTVQQIKDAFKWCKEAGVETRAFMMLGLPTETKEESLETIRFAKELDPDWAQFTITTPYPGTELYKQANEHGELKSIDWNNYQTWAGFSENDLVWTTNGRESSELKALQRKALREFYFRPKFILKKLVHIDNLPIFRKYVLGAWALLTTGEGRAME